MNLNKKFINPYKINPHDVRYEHFRFAKLYHPELDETWEKQYFFAKKKYKKWISNLRKQEGWYDFRKGPVEICITKKDENEKNIIIKKIVPFRVAKILNDILNNTNDYNIKYLKEYLNYTLDYNQVENYEENNENIIFSSKKNNEYDEFQYV